MPAEVLQQTVDFLRRFSDAQHHGKEEDHLFPKLRQSLPMAGGPVSMMLMEHQIGRSHIARMAEAAKAYAEGNLAPAPSGPTPPWTMPRFSGSTSIRRTTYSSQ